MRQPTKRRIAKAMRIAAENPCEGAPQYNVLEDVTQDELIEHILENNDGDGALFKILSLSLGLEGSYQMAEYWCEVDRQLSEILGNQAYDIQAAPGSQKVWRS